MPAATEIAGRDLPAFGDDLAGVVPEGLPDAQQLAALVNDALIEQARRHGLDLS